MKKILFVGFCSLFCFTTVLKAQEKKSFAGISIGASMPTGDFGSNDLSNDKAGLAKTGLSLNLSYGYHFSKNFGGILMAKGNFNAIDMDTFRQQFSVPTGSGASYSIGTGSYKSGAVLAGMFANVPITGDEKFSFEVRALAGYQNSTIPKINASMYIPSIGTLDLSQESFSSGSFAYVLGAGFKYKVGNNLDLKLNGDYNGANPSFEVIDGNNMKQSYKQPWNTVDVTLGLTIGF